MTQLSYFERLLESVDLIARHAYYPGKHAVVAQCAEEIADLRHSGRITGDQEELLRDILSGGCCRQRTA